MLLFSRLKSQRTNVLHMSTLQQTVNFDKNRVLTNNGNDAYLILVA